MEDIHPLSAPSTTDSSPRSSSRWRAAFKVTAIFVLILSCGAIGVALSLLGGFYGTPAWLSIPKLFGAANTIRDPRKAFPGQDRITVLCLGLDRNYLISKDPKLNGMPYTKGSRSDVMMVASLDLAHQTVSILSVPRDTRVRLPGKRYFSKINQAHADGGIPYTRQAVEEFLGIKLDHHVVIKQEAIQGAVSALGGLRLQVEKDMKYDDNWGGLHIDLKEGEHTLNGEQVVGYMRFRKDQEGDFGRMRRQQQVIQTLSERVKSPAVLMKAHGLIGALRKYIQTDLTPDQQLALATLFHKVQTGNIVTASLPVAETATIREVSYVIPDDWKKEAAVDWLLRGNHEAMNRLIRVEVRDASGDRELFRQTYDCLRHYGFDVTRGRTVREPAPVTRAVQHGTLRGAGRRVLEVLGLGGNVERSQESGPDVTLYVGQDLQDSPILAYSDSWPEIPERPRPTRVARRSRRSRDRVPVRVRRAAEEPDTEDAAEPADPSGAATGEPAQEPPDGDQSAPTAPTPPTDVPGDTETPTPPTQPE